MQRLTRRPRRPRRPNPRPQPPEMHAQAALVLDRQPRLRHLDQALGVRLVQAAKEGA